jgi:hypothetical protein
VEAPFKPINTSETTEIFGPKIYLKGKGPTEAICIGFASTFLASSLTVIER